MKQNVPIRIALIGATGSVGSSVLDVCSRFPDRFKVSALAAYSNEKKLIKLAEKFKVKKLCLTNPVTGNFKIPDYDCMVGVESLSEFASNNEIDHVVFASSGVAAIKALQVALNCNKDVSLANKESIVVAGPWVMPLLKRPNQLRPIDSEHNAIWQCLRNDPYKEIERICLTASGGPFRNHTISQMEEVTPEQALNHPVWKMGAKVTVDSASLMNKGIECIEAMQLFNLPVEKVSAVIHPKSQVHGIVFFNDSTMQMLVSQADMRIPVASALAWPSRLNLVSNGFGFVHLLECELNFREIDKKMFPCFQIALNAGAAGGAYPALLVGADESAVNGFLKGDIPFTAIPKIIEAVFSKWQGSAPSTVEEAIALVDEGKRIAYTLIKNGRNSY